MHNSLLKEETIIKLRMKMKKRNNINNKRIK